MNGPGNVSSVGYRGDGDIGQVFERNQEASLYVGNLDLRVDDEIVAELFSQCGVVKSVNLPRDKVTGAHSGFCFIEFENEIDSEYAVKIMNMIKLYGKPLRISKASHDKRNLEVGANLFIGNLDPEVDDKLLFDTFSAFGPVVSAKVNRDPDTGEPKGFGFVAYDTFDAADNCVANMNGQFLCNRPIQVSFAYKKDTKGERHGSAAERLIAASRPAEKISVNASFSNAENSALSAPLAQGGREAALAHFPQSNIGMMPGVPPRSGPSPIPPPPPGTLLSPNMPTPQLPMNMPLPPPPNFQMFQTHSIMGGNLPPGGSPSMPFPPTLASRPNNGTPWGTSQG